MPAGPPANCEPMVPALLVLPGDGDFGGCKGSSKGTKGDFKGSGKGSSKGTKGGCSSKDSNRIWVGVPRDPPISENSIIAVLAEVRDVVLCVEAMRDEVEAMRDAVLLVQASLDQLLWGGLSDDAVRRLSGC